MSKHLLNNLLNIIKIKSEVKKQHPQIFSQYKNYFCGKNIVLCAAGPTVNYFENIENAIYVGINRSFLNSMWNLDFLFIQDKLEDVMQAANEYKKETCKKFYGKLSKSRLPNIYPISRIPMSDVLSANASQYILENNLNYNFAHNIAVQPIGDFAGTVFSAMQFILYTYPKRIYIVGCDCSSGHFYNINPSADNSYQIKSWEKIKNFINKYYSDIEIISVNPVGLRGMFKDVYTQSYLDANPDIAKELGDDVEILEDLEDEKVM